MPTYRNDNVFTMRVTDFSGEVVNVPPAHPVTSYKDLSTEGFTEVNARPTATMSISGEGTFTDWLRVGDEKYLNLSVSGESGWSAAVLLERSLGGHAGPKGWYSEDTQETIEDPNPDSFYRIGVPSGQYNSGVVVVRLDK